MAERYVYLDHSATTAVEPRVLEAMLPFFTEHYGNPSSIHRWGQQAHQAVEGARRTVARILGCTPRELIFTACGTESDNLAIRGVALARRGAGRHLISTPIEHRAVLDTMGQLVAEEGFELTIVPVDGLGRVAVADVAAALRPDTVLVSVMYANNEVGTVQPIAELGALLREHPALLHVDAVQAGGFLPLGVAALGVDLLALSGHKFHAPKGVGLLYLRRGTPYISTMTGAGQEAGRRAGTHNVPLIVGLAAALALAHSERAHKNERLRAMRDRLIEGVLAGVPGARLTGHPSERLPGHASFTMGAGLQADALLSALDVAGIAASSGSACSSGRTVASPVLRALGIPDAEALSALRLTLGDDNVPDEVEFVVRTLPPVIQRLRTAHALLAE